MKNINWKNFDENVVNKIIDEMLYGEQIEYHIAEAIAATSENDDEMYELMLKWYREIENRDYLKIKMIEILNKVKANGI